MKILKQIKKVSGEYIAQQNIKIGDIVEIIDTDFFSDDLKEIILKSKKFPNLILQIFNDKEFGMIGENEKQNNDDFFINNEYYAYEVLKLLEKAKRIGVFDKIKQ